MHFRTSVNRRTIQQNMMRVKASTERKIIRWMHIILSIPIVGFIYGPVSTIPQAVTAVRFVLFPMVILSGLWMWKGSVIKRMFTQGSKT
jgi:thiosulfate reductase cytochrome b subunit